MNSRPTDEELAAKAEHAAKLQRRHHFRKAAECYGEVVSAYVPESSYLALRSGWGYAECLYHTDRADKALELMRQMMPVWEERFDLAHPTSIRALSFFIRLLRKQKAWEELVGWQRKQITAVGSCYGTDSFKYVDALAVLHTALHNVDRRGEEHRDLAKQFRTALKGSLLKWLRVWRRPWKRPHAERDVDPAALERRRHYGSLSSASATTANRGPIPSDETNLPSGSSAVGSTVHRRLKRPQDSDT